MSQQRIALLLCLLLIVIASVASRLYFEGVGGYIAPLMAPLFFFPGGGLLLLGVFWLVPLAVGIVAWRLERARLSYLLVSLVLVLIGIGQVADYQFAHAE